MIDNKITQLHYDIINDIMNCIKLITSTPVTAKTIIKIVERLKSCISTISIKTTLLPCNFLTIASIIKKSRTFSSTYSSSRLTSLAFAIFPTFVIRDNRRRGRFIDATQDVYENIVFNYLVKSFSFSLITFKKARYTL